MKTETQLTTMIAFVSVWQIQKEHPGDDDDDDDADDKPQETAKWTLTYKQQQGNKQASHK